MIRETTGYAGGGAQQKSFSFKHRAKRATDKGTYKLVQRVMFKVMAYGYQCGIYSTRKLEEACQHRVDFILLLENGNEPDHTTLSQFRTGRCIKALGLDDNESVFLEGKLIPHVIDRVKTLS